MRSRLRAWLFRTLRRALLSDDGRALVREACGSDWDRLRELPRLRAVAGEAPYADLAPRPPRNALGNESPCFITSRFRSGSTLLWNVFRHVPGCTAYYEPLNERRWFDPRTRGNQVDGTHRGVADYWREYDGLEDLGALYDERWIDHDLYMGADHWAPALKSYVETLIGGAPQRAVLQFNRVDFRLPWLRANFPTAKIVHLYRHPRDQWCSIFQRTTPFPPQGRCADFGRHDEFYLLRWSRDLRRHFPFLDESAVEHPYEIFYYIWKLSYLFGRAYGDYSLAFEDLVADPPLELERLFAALEFDDVDVSQLVSLVDPPRLGQWRTYADEPWFTRYETRCEVVLAEFFRWDAAERKEAAPRSIALPR